MPDSPERRFATPSGGRTGANEPVLAPALARLLARGRLTSLPLLLCPFRFGSLKQSLRQLLEVFACFRPFFVFCFHAVIMRLPSSDRKLRRAIRDDIQSLRQAIADGILTVADAIRRFDRAEQERYETQNEQQRPSTVLGIRDACESIAQSQKTAHPPKWHKDRTFLVSLAGVLVVFGYTTFAALQWYANKEAADAAHEAAKVAKNTLIYSERAYVMVTGLQIQKGRNGLWIVAPIIVNTGNTPTRNLLWTQTMRDWDPYLPFGTKRRGQPGEEEDLSQVSMNRLTLGPRQESRDRFEASEPIPEQNMEDIRAMKMDVYIHGALVWDDILSKTHHIASLSLPAPYEKSASEPLLARVREAPGRMT